MSIELYPSVAKIKRNGVYENLPGFVPETGSVATQQMIATAESSNVAQYAHNKGEYFRLNDTLYQAIVKINVGDSIVVGTNCKVAVIGNDLTNIANSIASYELGIATGAHNKGDYFFVNDELYVATANIKTGDSISTSTNCKKTVLADEVSTQSEVIVYENLVENEDNCVVNLGRLNGKYEGYTVAEISQYNNLFFANGTMASSLTRFSLTGGVLDFRSGSPTYASKPNWYVNNLNDFIVGHKYQFVCELLSGTITPSDPTQTDQYFFTFRTTDQSLNNSVASGYVWDCTVVPNMVCFVLRLGTFNNCVWDIKIIDLTKKEMVTAKNAGLFDYTVPSYFNTQLSTAITKINGDINSNKTEGTYGTDIESFVFITDVHWGLNKQHSPALIKKIIESCPISTVVCGGDFINESNTKVNAVAEIKGFTDAITQIPCYDYFAVCGNHDSNGVNANAVSEQFTKEEEFNLIYSPFSYNANVHWIWDESSDIYSDGKIKNDFYVDHTRTRTRYLCIDWNHPYSTARQTWIESVLAQNDGFRVVVIYHGVYKSLSDASLSPEHYEIMNILAPYKSKIVAVFCGHAHQDAVIDYYEDGSVPIIITSCDKFSENAGAVADTVNEQCFDVVVIDYGQSKIELTRIGRGSNRTVNISMT